MELDDFDLQILQSLQEDNQRTSQDVAERVNLSPVSCLRRMKRLRESKVVTADVSVVDPAAVGRAIRLACAARSAAAADDPNFGKVREPLVRMTNWARAFGAASASGERQILPRQTNRMDGGFTRHLFRKHGMLC